MEYLKLFNEYTQYEEYITNSPLLPNVSYVIDNDTVYYNPYVKPTLLPIVDTTGFSTDLTINQTYTKEGEAIMSIKDAYNLDSDTRLYIVYPNVTWLGDSTYNWDLNLYCEKATLFICKENEIINQYDISNESFWVDYLSKLTVSGSFHGTPLDMSPAQVLCIGKWSFYISLIFDVYTNKTFTIESGSHGTIYSAS